MYSFIEGNIEELHPTQVVLNNQGIGYEIEISLKTFEQLKDLDRIKLYVHQIVREDGHYLYGFFSEVSKSIFKKLISVSGIGPNTGRLILSGMSAEEVVAAIRQESDVAFKRVKGVGPKTAKRVILDLKDKINDLSIDDFHDANDTEYSGTDNTIHDEALSALIALGFRRTQVSKAVDNVIKSSDASIRVEDVIKSALKVLTGG